MRLRRRAATVLVACLLTPALATSAHAASVVAAVPTTRIAGHVTAPAGQSPASADVTVFDDAGGVPLVVAPDDDGAWSVDGLPAGRYTVGFNMSEGDNSPYAPEWYRDVPETSGRQAATVIDTTVDPDVDDVDETVAVGGVVSGTVLDDQGRPVADSEVEAYDPARVLVGRRIFTEGNGRFSLRGLGTARYVVRARLDTDGPAAYYYLPNGTTDPAAAQTVQATIGSTAEVGELLVGDVRTLTATARPRVDGAPAVGSVVTASAGTWSVPGAGFSYSWLRNGAPIGVTASTYRVGAADVGQRLSVLVSASRPGSISGSSTSEAVTVGRVASSTALKAKGKRKRKATLTITVSTPGVTPAGTVTIRDGRKVVRTVAVPASGRVVVTLSRLRNGRHTFVAVYRGSGTAGGSSASAKAKVRR